MYLTFFNELHFEGFELDVGINYVNVVILVPPTSSKPLFLSQNRAQLSELLGRNKVFL